jgi:diaminopimelate epimerase
MMIEFVKMNGAGNDFVILEDLSGRCGTSALQDLARRVCPRRTSVGADGLVVLQRTESADLRMRIFNPDGSEAEMCGNAARCVADYAHRRALAPMPTHLHTLAGVLRAEAGEGDPRIQLTDPRGAARHPGFTAAGQTFDIHSVDTGVPHAVVPVADLELIDLVGWGRAIRVHEAFAPAGTNVDFVCPAPDGALLVRTYERGVEDETLACGTGVTASALAARILYGMESPVRVRTRGGEDLTVHFDLVDGEPRNVLLEGPVRWIYEGRLFD